MPSHIAAVTNMTTPTPEAAQQAEALLTQSSPELPQEAPRDEAAFIDAGERAEAEQALAVIDGQIQDLLEEISQAPADQRGEMLANVATLSALKTGISGALSSGDGKALTKAMSIPRNAAINEALDETDEKETQAGEVAEEIAATELSQPVEASHISTALQQRNIIEFEHLDVSAQNAVADNTTRLVQNDDMLNGLFTLQYMIQNNSAMRGVFDRTESLISDSLNTLQVISENSGNAALQSVTSDLLDLRDNHNVQHAWLPATISSLSNGSITAQEFIDTAARYVEEEKIALGKMAQKAFAALPEPCKHVMHQIAGEDCNVGDMLDKLDYYKQEGFLETAQINQSFSDVQYSTDALIQTLALFDSGVSFQQSLLNMQMDYANLPDADKKELAEHICKDECTLLNAQQPSETAIPMLDNAFSGRNIDLIFNRNTQQTPTFTTHDHQHEGKLEQQLELQKG